MLNYCVCWNDEVEFCDFCKHKPEEHPPPHHHDTIELTARLLKLYEVTEDAIPSITGIFSTNGKVSAWQGAEDRVSYSRGVSLLNIQRQTRNVARAMPCEKGMGNCGGCWPCGMRKYKDEVLLEKPALR